MLQPDKTYSFLWDKKSKRPACALLQALHGFNPLPIYLFDEWQVSPVPTLVRITATGQEIMDFASKRKAKLAKAAKA